MCIYPMETRRQHKPILSGIMYTQAGQKKERKERVFQKRNPRIQSTHLSQTNTKDIQNKTLDSMTNYVTTNTDKQIQKIILFGYATAAVWLLRPAPPNKYL